MKRIVSLLLVGWSLAALAAVRVRRADGDDDEINLDPTKTNKTKTCKTKEGKDGQCFPEYMCSEAHVFQPGGIIDDSEIRRKDNQCSGFEWCCTVEGLITDNSTLKPDRANFPVAGCRNAQEDSCPYCVALYRDKGNPRTKSPSGLFCGGTIVGTRTVLTSTACILAAKTSKLWVRLPGSTKEYVVRNRTKHPEYSSGTAEHDIGLLTLEEDIVWPESNGLGACLGFKTPLQGPCVAIGFDNSDKMEFTPMSVSGSSCTDQGSTYDAGCGRATGACSVVQGSPVLCPADGEGLIVAGVVRQPCVKDSVLLGSLKHSSDFVRETLQNNSVSASSYSPV